MGFTIIFLIWILWGIISAVVGLSGWLWYLIGFLLGPLVYLLFMKVLTAIASHQAGSDPEEREIPEDSP